MEATIQYLAGMDERPFYYMYEPPEGEPRRNVHGDGRQVRIHDARSVAGGTSLAREGVALIEAGRPPGDPLDPEGVRKRHYPEVEELVASAVGARRVVAFDHNVRSGENAERADDLSLRPVRFAHNDYTEASGPQRVRDLLPDEADDLLAGRFAVINLWRPWSHPVFDTPLAVCDARSIAPGDLVETDLRYRERTGEIYSLRFNPGHRWLYFPRMEPEEAMLLKCYDSATDEARFTAHSAFDDPLCPEGAPPRRSLEVRTLAFF